MNAVWLVKMIFWDVRQMVAYRAYRERVSESRRDGWNLDVAFAAYLGIESADVI